MKAALVLGVLVAIAYAAPHHDGTEGHQHEGHHCNHTDEQGHHRAHHGSVCSLPEQSLAAVVDCVVQNVTEEIRGKLERRDGTLENNRTDVFTHEQNVELRAAFMGCRPHPVVASEESAQHATEATA
ncbi:hypothetical protein MTO96_044208 [Rhipicephalus appendiculatus]